MYLMLDTESGGPSAEYSLLSAAFIVTDHDLDPLDRLELYLKHDPYKISPLAMQANKIDLMSHNSKAMAPSSADQELFAFLKRNKKSERLTPVGHGLFGDLELIYQQLLGKNTFCQFVSFCGQDTGVIAQYLIRVGIISPSGLGLEEVCRAVNVDISDLTMHDAMGDAIATLRLYKKELSLIDICY